MSSHVVPPGRGGLWQRFKNRLKFRVRYWVTGPQILHWDDGDTRLTWDHPSYPITRTMLAYRGEPGEMHIGKYSALHYTCTLLPGGLHHTDWVGTLHAHVDERGDWVLAEGAVFGKGPITIGNDVYVGFESIVLSGVTIGDGAVIAARSVITKDVEPYSITAGNPAQHVRYRFDEPTREALLRIRWWDWSTSKVAAHSGQINSPEVKQFVADHDPDLGRPSCEVCRSGPA